MTRKRLEELMELSINKTIEVIKYGLFNVPVTTFGDETGTTFMKSVVPKCTDKELAEYIREQELHRCGIFMNGYFCPVDSDCKKCRMTALDLTESEYDELFRTKLKYKNKYKNKI